MASTSQLADQSDESGKNAGGWTEGRLSGGSVCVTPLLHKPCFEIVPPFQGGLGASGHQNLTMTVSYRLAKASEINAVAAYYISAAKEDDQGQYGHS